MQPSDLPRHQLIRTLTAQHPEKMPDAAIGLWGQMATQIISIVGEGGFNSLYARSVFLTQSNFPWLEERAPPQTEHRFAKLKTSLAGQTPAQASAANSLLLITFTDILATLIGEHLTASILGSAWGNDASDRADQGVQQ